MGLKVAIMAAVQDLISLPLSSEIGLELVTGRAKSAHGVVGVRIGRRVEV